MSPIVGDVPDRRSQLVFNPQALGMADDVAPAAAAAKWRGWKAANHDPAR